MVVAPQAPSYEPGHNDQAHGYSPELPKFLKHQNRMGTVRGPPRGAGLRLGWRG